VARAAAAQCDGSRGVPAASPATLAPAAVRAAPEPDFPAVVRAKLCRHPLYEQYPFRVKVAYRDYIEQPSFWEQGPTYYGVTELHMASGGFDYNMGDISLEYPPTHDFGFWPQPALAQLSDSVWHRVRSLHFSPDSNKGRVIFSPLPSASRYNAFTNRVELPKEQVLDFRLNMSPQQRQRPQ
jgi:hypothetical protein